MLKFMNRPFAWPLFRIKIRSKIEELSNTTKPTYQGSFILACTLGGLAGPHGSIINPRDKDEETEWRRTKQGKEEGDEKDQVSVTTFGSRLFRARIRHDQYNGHSSSFFLSFDNKIIQGTTLRTRIRYPGRLYRGLFQLYVGGIGSSRRRHRGRMRGM